MAGGVHRSILTLMVFLSVDRILQLLRRPVLDAPRPAAPSDAQVERRLRSEPVVWVSTTDERGFPHIVPIWYVWDGEAFMIFSKPHARKVRAVRSQPRVALALGEPRDDFDVQLIEGHATVLPMRTADALADPKIGREHARKYAAELFALGIGLEEYVATYSAVMRVVPTRFLPWRGRGPRWTASTHMTALSTG